MTVSEARKIVGNQPRNCIINMKLALSMLSWHNTADDNARLEACKVLIASWGRK